MPKTRNQFKKSLTQLFPKLDEYRPPGGKGPWQWTGIALTDDGRALNAIAEMTEGEGYE